MHTLRITSILTIVIMIRQMMAMITMSHSHTHKGQRRIVDASQICLKYAHNASIDVECRQTHSNFELTGWNGGGTAPTNP